MTRSSLVARQGGEPSKPEAGKQGGKRCQLRRGLALYSVGGSKGSGDVVGMASKKTVTTDNLVALGPERLAAILVELADGDAKIKRRLRLEMAAQAGDDTIAAEISKRFTSLRSARSFVDWQQRRDFVKGLDLQRAMIVDRVAQTRADLALDLMWRFMDLAEPVLNRVDDSNGSMGDIFPGSMPESRDDSGQGETRSGEPCGPSFRRRASQ